MSESEKIQVLLRAVGSAPVLKKQTFMLSRFAQTDLFLFLYYFCFLRSHHINFVINFLSKKMCKDDERIFIYIHQSFSPTPDTNVGLLYDNYQRLRMLWYINIMYLLLTLYNRMKVIIN